MDIEVKRALNKEVTVRPYAFVLSALSVASCTKPVGLEVTDAWTRDTIGRTDNAAVFMTISSGTPDRLLSASAPVAKNTDLMTMAGGSSAMEMTYVQGVDVPAKTPVRLNPAGLHVWLAGLNHPLRAGQTFPLTLKFEKAGQRQVTVSVVAPAAPPP
jgi:copper(I)-binding protein